MAIHPHYAQAILDGSKRVEFRKRPLAADVATVVIYATAPMKCIVGEFMVERTLVSSPDELWPSVRAVAGVDRMTFDAYYADTGSAAAIMIKDVLRYPSPVPLAALHPQPATPQSFTYLQDDVVQQLQALIRAPRRSLLIRLADSLTALLHGALPQEPKVRRAARTWIKAPD